MRLWMGFGLLIVRSLSSRGTGVAALSTAAISSGFKLIAEEVMFPQEGERAWRKIIRREVLMPDQLTHQFDVLSQGAPSVVVFCWDTGSRTTTLVKEYQPGPNEYLYGTVAGMFESTKHSSSLQCAQFELEEEARLRSSWWVPLLDADVSIPFDKYSDNRFFPFLALDCKEVKNPRPRDETEFIEIERGVTKQRLDELIGRGEINVASSFCILMGMNKLRQMGLPLD